VIGEKPCSLAVRVMKRKEIWVQLRASEIEELKLNKTVPKKEEKNTGYLVLGEERRN